MSLSLPALVKPSLLVWARESAGLQLGDAAKKAKIRPDHLKAWEAGDGHPSLAQLRKLAEVYKRPLAVFFLPEPPQGFDPQREFRRLAGVSPHTESSKLRFALRLALFRRETARDVYKQMGERVPEIKAAADPDEDAEIAGQRIRDLLGISWETQIAWANEHSALNAWREAVERLGVLVFQTGGVRLEEMRGTSIPHGPLPVILINTSDEAPHGRIFTLIHEFSHILLVNAGHRTSPMEGRRSPEEQILEQASNRFAAAALMPKHPFLEELRSYHGVEEGEDRALARFANRIKVSPEAILRRLVSLHRVSNEIYKQKREEWSKRPPPPKGRPPIIPIQVRVVSSAGRSFVSLILHGYQRNAISSVDVSDSLGVQLKYLDKIAAELIHKPGVTSGVS